MKWSVVSGYREYCPASIRVIPWNSSFPLPGKSFFSQHLFWNFEILICHCYCCSWLWFVRCYYCCCWLFSHRHHHHNHIWHRRLHRHCLLRSLLVSCYSFYWLFGCRLRQCFAYYYICWWRLGYLAVDDLLLLQLEGNCSCFFGVQSSNVVFLATF